MEETGFDKSDTCNTRKGRKNHRKKKTSRRLTLPIIAQAAEPGAASLQSAPAEENGALCFLGDPNRRSLGDAGTSCAVIL
jgi:hypothetical protein